MKSILIYAILILLYQYVVYTFLWIKTDNVYEIDRHRYFSGKIISIECRYGGRRGKIPVFNVLLDTNEAIQFNYLGLKSCESFFDMFPQPANLLLEAHFRAANIKKLVVDNNEIISFTDETKRTNKYALVIALIPLFVVIISWLRKKWIAYNTY